MLWSSSPPSTRRTPSPDDNKESVAQLLRWYDTPGLLPPYSRIDPRVKQRERQGSLISLKTVWKLGALLASKSTEMATDFISHHIFGPKRPTWGIEVSGSLRHILPGQ
ncbi:hypothetical protein FRC03_003040 [Tulasnella sp. 419]|nr:hypothetical protein FRC03_003040 [Tulasnella sp. 419]